MNSEKTPFLPSGGGGGGGCGDDDDDDDMAAHAATIFDAAAKAKAGSKKMPTTSAACEPEAVQTKPPATDATATTSRFADYFVICGLDLDTGLEPDRFAGKRPHFNYTLTNSSKHTQINKKTCFVVAV